MRRRLRGGTSAPESRVAIRRSDFREYFLLPSDLKRTGEDAL